MNGGGDQPPLYDQIKYIDQQVTIAATGGLLTMLAEVGSGSLTGGAHQDTFLQIATSDAVTLAGILENAIDVPLLKEHFPISPLWPTLNSRLISRRKPDKSLKMHFFSRRQASKSNPRKSLKKPATPLLRFLLISSMLS